MEEGSSLPAKTYVLVPGSWHGAWCWYKVVPLLKREARNVISLDLQGHGKTHTTIRDITSLLH